MARDYNSRRQDLDRMERQARYRHEQEMRRSREYYDDQWERPNNTLGPNEEVMEKRRNHRKHVFVSTGSSHTKSVLGENLVLLAALVASIYGLYSLCIYILNQ